MIVTTGRRDIQGYSRAADPEKVQYSASYGLFFGPTGPKLAQEAFSGYEALWSERNGSQARSARGIKGDLRVGVSFCRRAQDRGGPEACDEVLRKMTAWLKAHRYPVPDH